MPPRPEPAPTPVADDWLALKDAVKRFEQAWRQGRPLIDDHLPLSDPLRFRVLIELVHIDLELRLKALEAARVEEYLARYPELAGDRAKTIELIAAEYQLRRRHELNLELEEYQRRFPQYGAELLENARSTVDAEEMPRHPADTSAEAVPEVTGFEVLG